LVAADGKITLEFAECLGGCEGAPCVLINDEQRHNVTVERIEALLAELHNA
jgi:NADH-quinone oxidoreductase subunit E